MTTRYSTCHFAEVMDKFEPYKGAFWCSFCGEQCEILPLPLTLEHDLELTLRRWKDGDCTLDDMFNRVNIQLERSYNRAFDIAQERLQANGSPKYIRPIGQMEWKEAATGDTGNE